MNCWLPGSFLEWTYDDRNELVYHVDTPLILGPQRPQPKGKPSASSQGKPSAFSQGKGQRKGKGCLDIFTPQPPPRRIPVTAMPMMTLEH